MFNNHLSSVHGHLECENQATCFRPLGQCKSHLFAELVLMVSTPVFQTGSESSNLLFCSILSSEYKAILTIYYVQVNFRGLV